MEATGWLIELCEVAVHAEIRDQRRDLVNLGDQPRHLPPRRGLVRGGLFCDIVGGPARVDRGQGVADGVRRFVEPGPQSVEKHVSGTVAQFLFKPAQCMLRHRHLQTPEVFALQFRLGGSGNEPRQILCGSLARRRGFDKRRSRIGHRGYTFDRTNELEQAGQLLGRNNTKCGCIVDQPARICDVGHQAPPRMRATSDRNSSADRLARYTSTAAPTAASAVWGRYPHDSGYASSGKPASGCGCGCVMAFISSR
jgi:hypothetical protein